MKEKLQLLMKTENLKPSQLAEILEIYPSVVSHILAGRNRVSLELSQKILRRFPRINPDWLILDSGEMSARLRRNALRQLRPQRRKPTPCRVSIHLLRRLQNLQLPQPRHLSSTKAEFLILPQKLRPRKRPIPSPELSSSTRIELSRASHLRSDSRYHV